MAPYHTVPDAACFNEPAYASNCKGCGAEDVISQLSLDLEEPSPPTREPPRPAPRCKDPSLYYDMSGDKILIIFNHYTFENTRHHRKLKKKDESGLYSRQTSEGSVLRTRDGTYEDVKNLEKTFRHLGFAVVTHDDWKYKDIMKYLTDVSKKDHSSTSCVAVAVLSHGKGSRLCAADRKYHVSEMAEKLRAAPGLAGKPKLFFIQACRSQHTQSKARQNDGTVFSLNADSLLLYSTFEDHLSYRDPHDGSWMMQALCEVIDAHHDSMNLVQMVTLVNTMMARKSSKYGKQMPVTEYNLKKFLKL